MELQSLFSQSDITERAIVWGNPSCSVTADPVSTARPNTGRLHQKETGHQWDGRRQFRLSRITGFFFFFMYSYHVLIDALRANMIHMNLNIIFYTHVERSPTKTISIRYRMETHTHTHARTHARTHTRTLHYTRTHTRTHAHTHTRTHTHSKTKQQQQQTTAMNSNIYNTDLYAQVSNWNV